MNSLAPQHQVSDSQNSPFNTTRVHFPDGRVIYQAQDVKPSSHIQQASAVLTATASMTNRKDKVGVKLT